MHLKRAFFFYGTPVLLTFLYTSFRTGDVNAIGIPLILGLNILFIFINENLCLKFNSYRLIFISCIPYLIGCFLADGVTRSVPYLIGFFLIALTLKLLEKQKVVFVLVNLVYIIFAVFSFRFIWFSYATDRFFYDKENIIERDIETYLFYNILDNEFIFNSNENYLISFYNPGCGICFQNFKDIQENIKDRCRKHITVLMAYDDKDVKPILNKMDSLYPSYYNLYLPQNDSPFWEEIRTFPYEVTISDGEEDFKGRLYSGTRFGYYSLEKHFQNCND
jgi:hypothetical protein